jgi:hypothetical protein
MLLGRLGRLQPKQPPPAVNMKPAEPPPFGSPDICFLPVAPQRSGAWVESPDQDIGNTSAIFVPAGDDLPKGETENRSML